MRLPQFVSLLVFVGLLLSGSTLWALTVDEVYHPRDTGEWVSDMGGLLATADLRELNRTLDRLERDTGVEFAVVTVPHVAARSTRQFADDLFAHWGIGKAGEDNGVLVVLNDYDRRLEIVVGRGMEGVLTRSYLDRMQDRDMVPHFRNDRFGMGLRRGVEAMDEYIRDNRDAIGRGAPAADTSRPATGTGDTGGGGGGGGLIVGLIIAFLALFAGVAVFAKGKRSKCPECKGKRVEVHGEKVTQALRQATAPGAGTLNAAEFIVYGCEAGCESVHIRKRSSDRPSGRITTCPQCKFETLDVAPEGMGHGHHQHGGRNQFGGNQRGRNRHGRNQRGGPQGGPGGRMLDRRCVYCGFNDRQQDRSQNNRRGGGRGGDDFGGGRAGRGGSGSSF